MHENDIRQLDHELQRLIAAERKGLVAFLRVLDRFDRGDGPVRLHCKDLWHYLEKTLHLSAPSVFRRTRALHLFRTFPQVEAPLEDGRLNLTTLEILGRVATPENVDDLIVRFAFKTKREAEELEVSIQPRHPARDGLRKFPERPPPLLVPASSLPSAAARAPLSLADSHLGSSAAPAPASEPHPTRTPVLLACPEPRGTVEPVARERWSLRVTLNSGRKKKLEQLKDLLSHKIPDGDLNAVFEEMLDCAIEKHGKRRGTVKPVRTRKTGLPPPTPGKRQRIKAWVRREVLERDGHRCRYVSPAGTRCGSTRQLELHHRDGALVTGSSTPDELETHCKPHNQLAARDVFGRAHIEQRIQESREARRTARTTARPERTAATSNAAPRPAHEVDG